jgi:hypothetical protein
MPSLKGLKPGDYRRLFPGDKSPGISPQGKVPGISPRIYIPGDKSPEISSEIFVRSPGDREVRFQTGRLPVKPTR